MDNITSAVSEESNMHFEESKMVNDIGDSTYLSPFTPVPYRIEQHLEFMDIFKDGHLLLGSSNLVNRHWSGSFWIFDDSDVIPLREQSLCGHGCDSCPGCGLFLNSWENVIIGEDTGKLSLFSLGTFDDKTIQFMPQRSATHHSGPITSLCLTTYKSTTISAGSDLRINVWDNKTFDLRHKYSYAHSMEITSVNSSLRGTDIFTSCSLDGDALMWDPRQPRPAAAIFNHEFGLTYITPINVNTVAIGTITGEVKLVDIRNKEALHTFDYGKCPVHTLSACSNKGLLAVCGNSNNIKVWDSTNFSLIYSDSEHRGIVRALAWNPQNENLYSCGYDKRIISHIVPSSQ